MKTCLQRTIHQTESMLNLAVKDKPPFVPSPGPSGRRAHFSASLPVFSARRKNSEGEEEEHPAPAAPATMPVDPSPSVPEEKPKAPSLPSTPLMKRKPTMDAVVSRALTPSVKRKSQSLDGRKGFSMRSIGSTLLTLNALGDVTMRRSQQEMKNLAERFGKIDGVLQPAYDRVVRTVLQTFPFAIGLKTVDQLPIPGTDKESGVPSVHHHLALSRNNRPYMLHINEVVCCVTFILFRFQGGKAADYKLSVSLFDLTYKQFFGKTWVGPSVQSKITGQKTRLSYNQVGICSDGDLIV